MRTLIVAAVAAMGMTGLAIADEAKGPAVMTDAQMDLIVAGDVTTPGNTVFLGFDNPAPGDVHPGLPNFEGGNRSARADEATHPDTSASGLNGTFGPWSAHFASDVIVCNDC